MITGSEEESRKLMMDAAVSIVASYGFEGFTTKKWAAAAGVAEGSLYYHFQSKDDLLNQTFYYIDKEIAGMLEAEEQAIRSSEEVSDFVFRVWDLYFNYLIGSPDKAMYYYRFRTSPRYSDEVQKAQLKYYRSFLDKLKEAQSLIGERAAVPFPVLWSYVLDSTASLAFRVITGGLEDTAETRKEIRSLFLYGILGTAGSKI